MNKPAWISLCLGFLLVCCISGYFLFKPGVTELLPLKPAENLFGEPNGIMASSSPADPESVPNTTLGPRTAPAGFLLYSNSTYRFSLFYPKNLKVNEIHEGKNAMTITFQDVALGQGFQVFVVPYKGTKVSDERFKLDVPSGVRKGVETVTLDGVAGAAFYSENVMLGETREVWFIRGGYLFEVTVPRVLEAMLRDILLTWRFE